MRSNLQLAAAAGMGLAVLAAGSAGAGVGSEFDLGLTATRPGAPTGMHVRVLYRDHAAPEGKAPPIVEVRLELPAGLRFDTAAVPRCDATDAQLRLLGRAACPPGSRVGTGSLTATTGIPGVDPVETDLTVFNGGDELIELVSFKGTDVTAGYDRLKIDGSTLTAHPPTTPGGPPDGRTTVREIEFTIDERGSFITTPPECPATGRWTSHGSFTFASYPAPVTAASETPCVPARDAAQNPAMRLTVAPRVVQSRERTRFRLRVRSTERRCRQGVTVRLGRRLARTNTRGRATVRTSLRGRGRRAIRATKPGCRSARAWLLVR
jgi:hypothetical protein